MEKVTPHITNFIDYLKYEKRYSQHTIRAYTDDLVQFFLFNQNQFGDVLLADISASFIRTWLAHLKSEGMTGKSLNRKISTLKSFFKFHIREGALIKNPTATLITPKITKRLPVYVEKQHLETLFKHVEFGNDWTGKTERLILELLYQTGMRLSELIHLRENQIDAAQCSIKILGKGNKERIIPCKKAIIDELLTYIASKRVELEDADNVVLFVNKKGNMLYPYAVWRVTVKYMRLVTTVNKKSPHVLRHSFATHLMNNGAELNAVKELLGHSSLAATQIYTHNTIEKLKDVYKKAHPKA